MEKMLSLLAAFVIMCYMLQAGAVESNVPEDEVEKKCKQEYNVDDSIFLNDETAADYNDSFNFILKDESNENHRCFVQCLMESYGYLKEGELNRELLINETRIEYEEEGVKFEQKKMESDIAACATETGEGKCNTSYQIAKCLFQRFKEEKKE